MWKVQNRSEDSLDASVAMRSKMSFTKELRMAIALLEIPVSGCTCFSTAKHNKWIADDIESSQRTFINVRGVSLLARLSTLLLLPISWRFGCLLRGFLSLSGFGRCFRRSARCRGFATSRCGFRSHLIYNWVCGMEKRQWVVVVVKV